MLRFVQTRGNVRVYEWRTGSAPEVTEEQSIRIDLSDEQDLANQSQDVSILLSLQSSPLLKNPGQSDVNPVL